MLDERLLLAASLYEPCELGADIGTDHAFLPAHLLRTGVCQRMIAADVSPGALGRARQNLARAGLLGRAELALADGLDAVTRPCGCISIMGMGGKTMAGILQRGADRLQGAALVLSAHTELPVVRQAIMDVNYHIVTETICHTGGRFYLLWKALPGGTAMSSDDLRYGPLLWKSLTPTHLDYAAFVLRVTREKLRGLRSAARLDEAAILDAQRDERFYQTILEG